MEAIRIHYKTADTWMSQNVDGQRFFGHTIQELYRNQHIDSVAGRYIGYPYVSPLRILTETLRAQE